MAIYMSWQGSNTINGDVTEQNHTQWIELTSFQWGVGRGIGSAMSGQASRESSIPSVSEIVVTKRMDSASPGLWTDSVAGQLDSTVTIVFTTTAQGDTKEFLKYELTNTGLSGYSISSGGDLPTESLSLNFTKVVWTFTSTDPTVSGTPVTQGYDLTTATTT
jgi:type VI secretion system secreted protein Hcp